MSIILVTQTIQPLVPNETRKVMTYALQRNGRWLARESDYIESEWGGVTEGVKTLSENFTNIDGAIEAIRLEPVST